MLIIQKRYALEEVIIEEKGGGAAKVLFLSVD